MHLGLAGSMMKGQGWRVLHEGKGWLLLLSSTSSMLIKIDTQHHDDDDDAFDPESFFLVEHVIVDVDG
jgi:hypothetical protein